MLFGVWMLESQIKLVKSKKSQSAQKTALSVNQVQVQVQERRHSKESIWRAKPQLYNFCNCMLIKYYGSLITEKTSSPGKTPMISRMSCDGVQHGLNHGGKQLQMPGQNHSSIPPLTTATLQCGKNVWQPVNTGSIWSTWTRTLPVATVWTKTQITLPCTPVARYMVLVCQRHHEEKIVQKLSNLIFLTDRLIPDMNDKDPSPSHDYNQI
jgi:hypothetical protein